MFIGSILFRFFGVLLRWIAINVKYFIKLKKVKVKFNDVWNGIEKNDFFSEASYEMSNIVIGFIFVLTICAFLFFLNV